MDMAARIDVVVRAGGDAGATRDCVERLRATRCASPFDIVVAGGAPGAVPGVPHFRSWSEAISARPGRDTALVSPSCVPVEGWLDRLRGCAFAEPQAASVSPFSNGAGPGSYPRFPGPNPQWDERDPDLFFRHAFSGTSIDVPAPSEACVLLTRAGLEAAAGSADLEAFRTAAAAKGLRHLLCAGVFIRDAAAEPPQAQEADAAMREFVERDPARPLRRRIDLARLRASPRPRLLLVTHAWGGGVERHVRDEARLLEDECEVLRLTPHGEDAVELAWLRAGEEFRAWFEAASWRDCVATLAAIGVARVHFHHVHGLPRQALELPRLLAVPFDVTLHDYYPVCPRYHLRPGESGDCERPAGCARCLEQGPAQWGLDLASWRALFRDFLARAARVIVPSSDMAARLRGYFPALAPQQWPHPEAPLAPQAVAKVAIVGGISEIKGARVLEACVADAARRGLPLHFHVIGHVDRPMATWPGAPLTISGSYPEDGLAARLAIDRPDAFLFLSQVPETWSYTLSAAMATSLPIVATRLGAFIERLAGHGRCTLVDPGAAADRINDALLALVPRTAAPPAPMPAMDAARYRELLAAPLRGARTVTGGVAMPALPGRTWFAPALPPKPVGLRDLFEMGVLAGHVETRLELARRVEEFEPRLERATAKLAAQRERLAGLQARLTEANEVHDRHERELQEALERARARIVELEGSTFWRMTAPLRLSVHGAKVAYRFARGLTRPGHGIVPRLGTARQIAKDEGILELLRRVRGKIAPPGAARASRRARPGLAAAIGPLRVPAAETPRVSVLIAAYGQDLHTFSCLAALAFEAESVPLEVIVMDDASPQPVSQALAEVRGVRFERNASNLGYLRTCNLGAGLARGEYLLLLNNDAIPAPGAIAALLDAFARVPDAGAVGAKLVYPDGRLQEAGGIVWRDASAWNDGRGRDPADPEHNYLRETDYCSAACLMVPTALFRGMGGFDERYVPAYYEDTDLCFRLREQGRRVLYQPAAEVVHFEGASHGSDLTQGVKRHQVENQAKFRERWAARLAAHRPNGMLPRLERDRHARRRVLFIEACMISPDQDSGSLRTWRLIEEMRALGCKVTFAAANLERREPYSSRLQQAGVEVVHAPYVRSIEELLRERAAEFDVIVLARYYVAIRYLEDARRHAPRALIVFDTIDLHYLRNRRLAELEGSATLAQGAEAIRLQEVECIRAADLTWVVSPAEQEILEREVPRATVAVLSNIHDVCAPRRAFSAREGLLFVGGFRHPPNVDAVLWLAREIVPRLARRLPGVTTYVVGSNAPKAIAELDVPGLEIVGYVPQVEPWLELCRVSVSPLRYGAGVKGKVNQAMSHGLPVVATGASIEGMGLVPGEEVLVADDPEAFVEAVARLYGDEALWRRLSLGGMANVERHFGRDQARASLAQAFALVERRRALISAARAEPTAA